MTTELPDAGSVTRVLTQTLIKEFSSLSRDKNIGRDADLIFNYFNQFFLFGDFEGIFADQHLVHHYT
jgi:hypothetical protein